MRTAQRVGLTWRAGFGEFTSAGKDVSSKGRQAGVAAAGEPDYRRGVGKRAGDMGRSRFAGDRIAGIQWQGCRCGALFLSGFSRNMWVMLPILTAIKSIVIFPWPQQPKKSECTINATTDKKAQRNTWLLRS